MLRNIKRYLTRLRERRKSLREGRNSTVYEIFHDDDGMRLSWLTMENETGQWEFDWRDVMAIYGFKRDCFGWDSIRLCLQLDDERTFEIAEEDNGWGSLVENLPKYLTGCDRVADWFDVVAQPPFALSWTPIYRRDANG
jgi:hypothetical protein